VIPLILSLLLQAPPDIVVFVLDDVAAADLALYGGPISCPNIEALAGSGVTFTRAYANPTCAPSRRSLLTGHWWVTGNGPPCAAADAHTPTLAEAFLPEALPAYTSGLIGKWHLGGNPYSGLPWEKAPIAHGFDIWTAGMPANVQECGGASYTSWLEVTADASLYSSVISTAYEPSRSKTLFLQGWAVSSSPRLAVVNLNLAHAPFHVPPASVLPSGYQVGQGNRGKFEAMVVAYDHLIGQMLAAVDLECSLVVVVGDNGTPPPVAPAQDKAKGTTFERGVRVPLVMAGLPVNAPGRSESALVHLVDIWATLVEAGSGSVPGGSPYELVGKSLMPYLAGIDHPCPREWVLVGSRWGSADGDIASVRVDGTKLRNLDADGDGVAETLEYYDLVADPGETTNLISDPARGMEIVEHMAWTASALP